MSLRLTILWIWKLIDPLFYSCSRLHYIYDDKNNQSVFRVRITKYKGENFTLSDGTMINRNDLLLKIHLHNVRLLNDYVRIKNDLKRARLMYKLVLNSMPLLASYLKAHPEEANIKGIIGITTINKGIRSLGFDSIPPANRLYRYIKKLGQLPISLLSSNSYKHFQKNGLTYLFLSKEKLYEKYGRNSSIK
ncbi:YkoP family protein [Neobacillus sp. NPDC097160]|uniref:YkoP family protein n=1 Tax=Neobacillus sp. NPDC097160 TaxID=3364298 RepID=UPI0037FC7D1C